MTIYIHILLTSTYLQLSGWLTTQHELCELNGPAPLGRACTSVTRGHQPSLFKTGLKLVRLLENMNKLTMHIPKSLTPAF